MSKDITLLEDTLLRFFFFQAEDGIRDVAVTGVQTCALPIYAMAANGMRDAGYQYVVIDDCWQVARDAQGRLIADTARFPGGIKPLADYVHADRKSVG